MGEELRQAKEKVKWEVDFAMKEAEKMAKTTILKYRGFLKNLEPQVVNEVKIRI